ncbi:hypothetical protein PFISCL1PPCAC_6514 [Pristionchus fissidentatus]|uniref:C2H2-type domain-containing protein n=1 Tax=Pristionchus fissidentatus TaxID=1538716 RepID=A0AAV5V6I4_9BILA|nr:hypothetical protein PFISCL1PPCAC_6514 [Pristionchus fissidentatus]
MLDRNWIDKSWFSSLRGAMLSSRQYLRRDFVIHGKEFSTTADHCWSLALSDPEDARFQVDCEKGSPTWMHSHSRICHQCETLQVFFGDMRATFEELAKKHKKDKHVLEEIELLRRDHYDWEDKIMRLKAHQIRTAKSENDLQWLTGGLKEGDVLMTMDFAMKLLPHHSRESTVDWYAQRGMVWHVTHVLTYFQGNYHEHNFVHIFEGARQDSATVTAIAHDVIKQLKWKGIKRFFIRSDQAGVYKSSSTIASIHSIAKELKVHVAGWYFSEAQAGKGPCDRTAARVKRKVRNYADSGKPVLNPHQFFDAVTHNELYAGISYSVVRLEGSGKDKKVKVSSAKIPNLSMFNAFTFEEFSLRVHRFWKIGVGKTIPYSTFSPNDALLVHGRSGGTLSEEIFWSPLGEPRKKHYINEPVIDDFEDGEDADEDEDEDEDEDAVCDKWSNSMKCEKKKKFISRLYQCPVETCAKEFLSAKNMERHMTLGNHRRRPERLNVVDYSLHTFSSFIEAVHPPIACPVVDDAVRSVTDDNANGKIQSMGWALPKRRISRGRCRIGV